MLFAYSFNVNFIKTNNRPSKYSTIIICISLQQPTLKNVAMIFNYAIKCGHQVCAHDIHTKSAVGLDAVFILIISTSIV